MSRGRQKRSIRDLSRDPPAKEDHAEMTKLQAEGPDLVLAITAAAQIEHEIEQLIIGRLKHRDAGTISKLTESNGPMSGLYSKVTLAYAMGILDDVTQDNINIIRGIRNAFAHAKRPIRFDAPEIMAELRKISLPPRKPTANYKALFYSKTETIFPRGRFSILCSRTKIFLYEKSLLTSKRKAAYWSRKSGRGLINNPTYFGSLAKAYEDNPHWFQDGHEGGFLTADSNSAAK